MSKITCDVIADILELYADEMVSNDTKSLVQEHLAACPACTEKLALIKQSISIPTLTKSKENPLANILKRIKKRIKIKQLILVTGSMVLVSLLVSYIYVSLNEPRNMTYEQAGITNVEIIHDHHVWGEVLRINFTGISHGTYGQYVVISEEEKTVESHIFFYDSIWLRNFRDHDQIRALQKEYGEESYHIDQLTFNNWSEFHEDYVEYEVVRVYYCEFDFLRRGAHKCGDVNLVWEKG